eukprot:Gb_37868 [translate_table: standard]
MFFVFRRLLSPLVTPDTLTIHPMTQLEILCKKDSLDLKVINSKLSNGIFDVRILVNQKMIANFEDENRRAARRLAATKIWLLSIYMHCIHCKCLYPQPGGYAMTCIFENITKIEVIVKIIEVFSQI